MTMIVSLPAVGQPEPQESKLGALLPLGIAIAVVMYFWPEKKRPGARRNPSTKKNATHKRIDALREFMWANSEFGAGDTEPRVHFEYMLIDALKGQINVPRSASGWELFTTVPGVGKFAQQLSKKARTLANHIKKNRGKKSVYEAVRYYVGWPVPEWDQRWGEWLA
jgi:hypothetical protein